MILNQHENTQHHIHEMKQPSDSRNGEMKQQTLKHTNNKENNK